METAANNMESGEVKTALTRAFGTTVKQVVRKAGVVLLLGTIGLTAVQTAQAGTLYRYINDKGYQEIGYSIPPHLVPNGYDVIDDSGRLIRRVAAQLSEEEYAIKLEAERKLEACERSLERVHRRYESLDDIDVAEQQFEKQLEESVRNYQANLEYSESNLQDQQERAARLERAGKPVPQQLLVTIGQLQTKIENLHSMIEGGAESKLKKAEEFDEERRVFGMTDCNEEQLAQVN